MTPWAYCSRIRSLAATCQVYRVGHEVPPVSASSQSRPRPIPNSISFSDANARRARCREQSGQLEVADVVRDYLFTVLPEERHPLRGHRHA